MKDARQRFLAYAISKVGCWYVWGGKGSKVWTPAGLVGHLFTGEIFDCSGLVTCAWLAATGLDWRATHSAQLLWDSLGELEHPEPGCLAMYGPGVGVVTHPALLCGPAWDDAGPFACESWMRTGVAGAVALQTYFSSSSW